MDTKYLLIENRSKHLKFMLGQCNKTEESLQEDVNTIKKWLKTQPHLPETPSDIMITNFLFFNKFSIEITKRKLDMYYTLKTLLPEVYDNKNPKLPHMQEMAEKVYTLPLRKVTKEGYRVSISKIIDEDVDNFDPYTYFGLGFNSIEVRILEDVLYGDIIIYDVQHVKLGHIIKFTPICLKKAVLILEEVFSNRVKGLHFINAPTFIDRVLSIVKPLMKPKIQERIHVHQTVDEMLKYLPREILPRDYGGDDLYLSELNELWKQKLAEYQDRFDALETMKTNESLRPTPLVNDDILGFYGNFKKLNVD